MRSALRYSVLLTLSPLLWILYALSGVIPRSPDLWVFGAWDGQRFADNTKWLFLHCTVAERSGRFAWVTRNRGLARRLRAAGHDAHYHRSLGGLWLSLRAKYYVIDHTSHDISFYTSRGSVKICLFHGIPLKRLRQDVDIPGSFNHMAYHGPLALRLLLLLTRPYLYESYDLVIATSEAIGRNYSTAFGTPMERVAVTGYPRNDPLLEAGPVLRMADRDARQQIDALKAQGLQIVMYLPTWRDHARHGAVPLDFEQLRDFLEDRGAALVTKFHSYDDRSAETDAKGAHFLTLGHEVDIYPLLASVDVLVTDYSSIAFDFLLLDRPIVYYCYDLDEYVRSARGFYHEYSEVTPGKKASSFDELVAVLDDALESPELYQRAFRDTYSHTMDLCHRYRDAGSAGRVYDEIDRRFGGG